MSCPILALKSKSARLCAPMLCMWAGSVACDSSECAVGTGTNGPEPNSSLHLSASVVDFGSEMARTKVTKAASPFGKPAALQPRVTGRE